MEKIVVYAEPANWLGHGETQQELYIKTMLGLQWKVILLTPAPHSTIRWSKDLPSSQKSNLYVHLLKKQPKRGFEKALKWRWMNNQVSQAEKQSGWKVNLVFLSWMDSMKVPPIYALLTRFIFKYQWVGLYFWPKHFRSDVKMRWWKRRKRILADTILMCFGRCKGIGVFEEGLSFGFAQKKNPVPIVFFPEITEKRIKVTEEIENIRRQADKRCIFGLLGDLSPRKGVFDFLRIAYEFDAKRGFFLLAGNFNIKNFPEQEQKEIRQFLQTKGRDNCYFRLTMTDPLEFNALVNICDVLYLSYQNHYHSSGLLAKAALFNKPVIVSAGYCMGQRVIKYNLGLTVNSNVYPEKMKAVGRLADTDFRNRIKESPGFKIYSAQNSAKALNSALQQLLH
jgi:hypothetical protein